MGPKTPAQQIDDAIETEIDYMEELENQRFKWGEPPETEQDEFDFE